MTPQGSRKLTSGAAHASRRPVLAFRKLKRAAPPVMTPDRQIEALLRSLHAGCVSVMSAWTATLGPENTFARSHVVKGSGFIPGDEFSPATGVICFAGDDGLVHWRFSMELGPEFAAAKLGLDVRGRPSEPDDEGIRWLGEG